MINEEDEKIIIDKLCEVRPDCAKCFCNDLCLFLLMKTGCATTCKDFQRRVRKVVDREMKK